MLSHIFWINWLIIYSIKCQKSGENAHLNSPEPDVMSLNCVFCPNNSPNHKDSFISLYDTEKQQILTFKRLNQQFFVFFAWKMTETINWLPK